MKQACQKKILKQFKQLQNLPQNKGCNGAILILDIKTAKLLSPLLDFSNLFDYGIKSIAKADKKKKPQPDAISIYYISKQSLPCIAKDFEKEPIYFSINILICEQIDEKAIQAVALSQKVLERVASFAELHFNCNYVTSNLALLNPIIPQTNLMSISLMNKIQYAKGIAQALAIAIFSNFGININLDIYFLGEYKVCQNVAKWLKDSLQKHYESIQKVDQQSQNSQTQRPLKTGIKKTKECKNIKLIIAERQFDIISPAVRSYYYYPMAMDLLKYQNLQKPKILIQQKQVLLDLENKIFQKYKNMHINSALNSISKDLGEFTKQSEVAKLHKKKQIEMNDKSLRDIIRSIPEYNKVIQSFNNHINLMDELLKINNDLNLAQIGQIQYLIITNLNNKGQTEKDKKIFQKYWKKIESLPHENIKGRLIFLMICCLELSTEEKKMLYKKLDQFQSVTYKMLGAFLSNYLSPKNIFKLPFTNRNKKKSIFLDRHQSGLYKLVGNIIDNKPDKNVKKISIYFGEKSENQNKFELISTKSINQWGIVMIGGLGINQISSLQGMFSQLPTQSINFITDAIYQPDAYISQLSKIKRN